MRLLPCITLLALCAAACGGVSPSDVAGVLPYPMPRSMDRSATEEVEVQDVCLHDLPRAAAPHALDLLSERGLGVGGGARCDWSVQFTAQVPEGLDLSDADEAYSVVTTVREGKAETRISARSDRGALYGWMAALAGSTPTATGAMVPRMTVVDHPSFARRGVVEGTYGIPFTTAERTSLIRTLGALRENTYIYSPKQDPYCRELWASAYPTSSLLGPGQDTIRTAVAESRRRLIDFVWGISPGLSYDFAKHDQEFPRLVRKIDMVRALGVTRFAIFLDDIPNTDAKAHARLVNALHAHLQGVDPDAQLMMVGATYAGTPDGYTRTMGSLLHHQVEVLWTGPKVVSESIRSTDLDDVNLALNRNAGIWDNWPRERFAVRRRGADLPQVTSGFYSNPVITEFNLHPLEDFIAVVGPIADYLWNAERYTATERYPQESFAAWLELLAPGR